MSDPGRISTGVSGHLAQAPVGDADLVEPITAAGVPEGKPRSLAQDAWDDLRHNWIFWASLILLLVFVVMALFPGLFTSKDPTRCDANNSVIPPGKDAWFGYDLQGCDVYARTIYGARASIAVGLIAMVVALLLGGVVGIIAGFYGGFVDSLLSRITDIFLAIPILLGGIILLTSFPASDSQSALYSIFKVALVLAILGWTATARISRSSVIQVKYSDYVLAARSLGASNGRIIRKHIIPNSLGPIIVVTTISMGAFIGSEATLSFLGIGLQPPAISWGIAISDGQQYIETSPFLVLFPCVFLSLTVLAFIMLGEAIREALDPRFK